MLFAGLCKSKSVTNKMNNCLFKLTDDDVEPWFVYSHTLCSPVSFCRFCICESLKVCMCKCVGGLTQLLSLVFSTNFPARAAYQVAALPRVSTWQRLFMQLFFCALNPTENHNSHRTDAVSFSRVDWLKLKQLLFWALWPTLPNKYIKQAKTRKS